MPPDPARLAARFLEVIETDIVPMTRAGVDAGNKVFGAAILRKDDLSLVLAGTNAETENPLFHGEIATLNAFYRLAPPERPATTECLFLSTHEPCPLCLSAIAWAGFDNFTYLFPYEATRDAFAIPHDLRMLEEVFGVKDGNYRPANAYWTSGSIADLVAAAPAGNRAALQGRTEALAATYADLSAAYQARKAGTGIPLP
jgi:tRNA(Arg) A34 adenosine deaminase TadA